MQSATIQLMLRLFQARTSKRVSTTIAFVHVHCVDRWVSILKDQTHGCHVFFYPEISIKPFGFWHDGFRVINNIE